MGALLKSLAMKYGYEYAAKLLGIDKQQGNPKYTFGMPFTNNKVSINPIRTIANQGMKSMMRGSSGSGILAKGIPLMAGALALGYYTNPLREGSYNYNPELQGQLDYASKMGNLNRNNSMGALRYDGTSVLSGQNAISGFGTNDYMGQLQKNLNRLEGYKNPNSKTFEMIERTKAEIEDLTTHNFDEVDKFMEEQEETTTNNNGGGGDNNYGGATQSGGFDPGGFEQDGTGRQGYGSGGIASLWQR